MPVPPPVTDELIAKGKEVFDTQCAACHGSGGGGGSGPAFTDGAVLVSAEGETVKSFSVRDGQLAEAIGRLVHVAHELPPADDLPDEPFGGVEGDVMLGSVGQAGLDDLVALAGEQLADLGLDVRDLDLQPGYVGEHQHRLARLNGVTLLDIPLDDHAV